ncbi:cationic amino acid transporter 2-like [Dendronephthya gigantea]|uniref:cationic amino acid transporter 2-like n=1 Tax=Dendronephthya gigantea TaxID=151771 RepID=UPI00106AD51C|nr:cationic amino acid transporter 2-like [Dendronephthya gigantea]
MCSFLSRFLNKITRTKVQDDEDEDESRLDFLDEPGRISVLRSIELLLGACFNSAIFIVIGISVKCIAGPAMVLSVILGAVFSFLNNLSLCELCCRFPTKTSYYAIIYDNVGELCAFVNAWFKIMQAIFMVSIVSVTVGEYIYYLAQPPPHLSWLPPHKMWAEIEYDTLVFTVVFLVVLSLIIMVGLPYCTGYLTALFWINLASFAFMFVLILSYAGSFHWIVPENFQPFNITGTVQGIAITMFFFTHLDRIVQRTSQYKITDYVVPVSVGVSTLCVFVYYLCATIFIANLIPMGEIVLEATIPKAFASATFHEVKYILASIGFVIFVITIIEAFFGAQNTLNLLVEDGLMHHWFSNSKKKTSFLSVVLITLLSIPLFISLSVTSLVQGFCISSLIITLIINCTTLVVQYLPSEGSQEVTSAFPNWECTKAMIIRFLLCFGYITHKKVLSTLGVQIHPEPTNQTSKLVNWCVVMYVPSCIGLALAMIYGLPGLGENKWVVLGAIIFLIITIFLNLRMILIQPRGESLNFIKNDIFASLIPLVNIGLSCILLVTLDWQAFVAVGAWLVLGLLVYFLFSFTHSNKAVFNRIQELDDSSPGRVRFDSPPQLSTRLRNIQPENTDSQQYVFSDDTELLDFPQNR